MISAVEQLSWWCLPAMPSRGRLQLARVKAPSVAMRIMALLRADIIAIVGSLLTAGRGCRWAT